MQKFTLAEFTLQLVSYVAQARLLVDPVKHNHLELGCVFQQHTQYCIASANRHFGRLGQPRVLGSCRNGRRSPAAEGIRRRHGANKGKAWTPVQQQGEE